MKDQIIKLLDDWKGQQKEHEKPEKKDVYKRQGHSNVISGQELSVSHLLTAGPEIPSAEASCSCVIPFALHNR